MSALRGMVCGLLILGCAACETVALRPRPEIDKRDGARRDVPRQEIIGTVEQVDKARKEIQLRTTEAQLMLIKFDGATLVYRRERNVGIEALQPGDLILVQAVKNADGDPHADIIRMNDRP